MTAPENLRCTICLRGVDSVEELRILPTAPMQVRFCAGECAPVSSKGVPEAGVEHRRLELVYGALRAALIDHGLSAEQRAPYTEAAARVVTRQLEFTGAALAAQSGQIVNQRNSADPAITSCSTGTSTGAKVDPAADRPTSTSAGGKS